MVLDPRNLDYGQEIKIKKIFNYINVEAINLYII